MAEKFGAGSDQLPGLGYQPNNGMGGGVNQAGNWNKVPCNTAPVGNQTGSPSGVNGYPDPSGSDPVASIQEFWGGRPTGQNR